MRRRACWVAGGSVTNRPDWLQHYIYPTATSHRPALPCRVVLVMAHTYNTDDRCTTFCHRQPAPAIHSRVPVKRQRHQYSKRQRHQYSVERRSRPSQCSQSGRLFSLSSNADAASCRRPCRPCRPSPHTRRMPARPSSITSR